MRDIPILSTDRVAYRFTTRSSPLFLETQAELAAFTGDEAGVGGKGLLGTVEEAWGFETGDQGTLEGMSAGEVDHKHAFWGALGKPVYGLWRETSINSTRVSVFSGVRHGFSSRSFPAFGRIYEFPAFFLEIQHHKPQENPHSEDADRDAKGERKQKGRHIANSSKRLGKYQLALSFIILGKMRFVSDRSS